MSVLRTPHPRVADRVAVTAAELTDAPHDWASDLNHSAVMDDGRWHSVLSYAVVANTTPSLVDAALYRLHDCLAEVYRRTPGCLALPDSEVAEAADVALFAGDRYQGSYAMPAGSDELWAGDRYLTRTAVDYLDRVLAPATVHHAERQAAEAIVAETTR